MNRICTVCARGGSKGVPNKNIRLLAGRPLISHSITQAGDSGLFNAIAVSSDADEILDIARAEGVTVAVQRPAALASDTVGKLPAIVHCVKSVERELDKLFDVIVDMDATSPLRVVKDIQEVVRLLETTGVSNVITGSEARRSPYFNLVEVDVAGTVRLSKAINPPVQRRQDAPQCFDMNASIYAWRREPFMSHPAIFYEDTRLYEMPIERSHDIDSELDFDLIEWLMTREPRDRD